MIVRNSMRARSRMLLLVGCMAVACGTKSPPADSGSTSKAGAEPRGRAGPEPAPVEEAKPDPEAEALAAEARKRSGELGAALNGRLMAAMKEGGPTAAVSACNVDAGPLTSAQNEDGWTVGRTALRLRNSENAPDDWERATLERFVSQTVHGVDPATIERYELDRQSGKFRYMKAIPTAGPCLVCHGAEVDPSLAEHIATLYPDDEAQGFTAGELRGAFTLEKQLTP